MLNAKRASFRLIGRSPDWSKSFPFCSSKSQEIHMHGSGVIGFEHRALQQHSWAPSWAGKSGTRWKNVAVQLQSADISTRQLLNTFTGQI